MLISPATIKILQNFSTIYERLVFKPGNVIRTVNEDGNLFAEATLEETFDREFGVYDLGKLLTALSMFKQPDLTTTDTSLIISAKGERGKVTLRHSNTKLIKQPPDKEIKPPYLVTFYFSGSDLKWVHNMSGILGTKQIAFVGREGKIFAESVDTEGKVADEGSLELEGKTEHVFKAVLPVERLKLMSGDYDVSVSSRGVVHFANKNTKLKYWVAMLKEPSEFT